MQARSLGYPLLTTAWLLQSETCYGHSESRAAQITIAAAAPSFS